MLLDGMTFNPTSIYFLIVKDILIVAGGAIIEVAIEEIVQQISYRFKVTTLPLEIFIREEPASKGMLLDTAIALVLN